MARTITAAGAVAAGLILFALALGFLLLPLLGEAGIKQAVERETGRSISFAGGPRLSLWPELAVELRGVELANPPGMSEGWFAAADTVRLELSRASLWRRSPEIEEIVVVRPRVNLLVDSEGRSNYVVDSGRNAPADHAAEAPPIRRVDGSVKFLNERSAAADALTDVDLTLTRAGIAGPVDLDGAFNWNDQRINVTGHAKSSGRLAADGSPVDFTLSAPYLSAAFSGRAALRDELELAGTLEFRAEPLSDLLAWAGHATELTNGLPAVSASGSLDLSRGAIRLSRSTLSFGRMKAQGDVAVSFAGERPRVSANLGIDRLDVTGLAGETAAAPADEIAGGWSEAPIDLVVLKAIDAELSLAISELAYGDVIAGPSRLDLGLANGRLEAELVDSAPYGGAASGSLTLDGSGSVAALEATLIATGMDGGKLSAALTGAERILGQTDVDIDLAATGASPQELVARLNGRAQLLVRDGALVDLDVPAMLGHVASGVADGWSAAGDGRTPFAQLIVGFVVTDGIAETENFLLRGPVAVVAGSGSIDLLRLRVDLKMRPRIAKSLDIQTTTLPVPVVVAGSWSEPKIYPDVAGILDDPGKAYETLRRRIEMDAAKLDLATRKAEEEPEETAATP
jgi:AsmA protein